MVNKIVLEYFRMNKGNYKIEDLKKKVFSAGYSQQDITDALNYLARETQGAVPSVSKTINQINKTNLPLEHTPGKQMVGQKPKKSKKWLWISLGIVLLVLILGAAAVWYFMPSWFGL